MKFAEHPNRATRTVASTRRARVKGLPLAAGRTGIHGGHRGEAPSPAEAQAALRGSKEGLPLGSSMVEGRGRATTAFMRQLTRMFEEQQNEIRWEHGTIVIPDPSALERILPMYYKTSKFSSFQRQLNNFGYHRSYDNGSSRPVDRSKARGVCYRKVAGAPACRDIAGLLSLRPLVRRKKRPAEPVIGQRRSLINSSHFLRPPPKRPRAESLENLNDAARCLVSFTCLKAASRVLV